MRAYPYRLCGDSVMAKGSETLRRTLDTWCRDWFSTPPSHTVHVSAELPAGPAVWRSLQLDQEVWVACRLRDKAVRDFMQSLLGQSAGAAHSPILADVLEASLGDLMQRLMQAYAADDGADAVPVETLEGLRTGAGSGVLYAAIDGALPISGVALGGAWVAAITAEALPLPTTAPLSPRRAALGQGEMRVELSLGEAELTLSELAGIAVGDVLALDIRHQDPLQLRGPEGNSLCKVHLGRVGQQMAVQVISK